MDGAVVIAGLLLGALFGATALRTNFCVMGSVTDILLIGDWRRFRAWLLAIAVALAGTQGLVAAGALGSAAPLAPGPGWLGGLVGGLLFGFGMTLAGGCAQRSLVRAGAGSLKSLAAVLTLAIFAALTAAALGEGGAGPPAPGLGDLLGAATGLGPAALDGVAAAAISGGLLWVCFKDAMFRASGRNLAAGLVLGALVPLGWWLTSLGGAPESLDFVTPLGDGLRRLAGPGGAALGFAAAAVPGVVAGAFLAVIADGRFRLEWFDGPRDAAHHLAGGALMGTGGALALGGTIGQGITGVSTLALGSLLAWAAIVGGAVAGLKYLEWVDRRGASPSPQ